MSSQAPQVPPRPQPPLPPVRRRASRGHPPSPSEKELVALIVLLVGSGFLLPVVVAIIALSTR